MFSFYFSCKPAVSIVVTLLILKLMEQRLIQMFWGLNLRSAPLILSLVGSGEDNTQVISAIILPLRDGYCRTDDHDHGVHVVCATMTENFLAFTKSRGNDLSSRRGGFPGLNPGDRWCLCAARWDEARRAGAAPLVNLSATHAKESLFYSFHQHIFIFILIAFPMQCCAQTVDTVCRD